MVFLQILASTNISDSFHLEENSEQKKTFPPARKCVSSSQNAFKNTFALDGKIKLTVPGVSQIWRKKWFPLVRKSVSTSRTKVIFQKLDLPVSTYRKKTLNKRILFQLDRKPVSTSGNGEFV